MIVSSINNLSKTFALPPIIDLYSDSKEQDFRFAQEAHHSHKGFQIVKRTLKSRNDEKDFTSQLKEQIRDLEDALQSSQKRLNTQAKTIQDLTQQLLQTSRTHLSTLPNLKANQAVQTHSRFSISRNSQMHSQSVSDWESLRILLKTQTYPEAESALKKFIQQYPKDLRIADAHYLLGQVALIQGKPDQALKEFNIMTRFYPQNKHIPYAHYHRALAYYAKGDHVMAESLLKKLEQQYPASEAAQKASQHRAQLGLI